MNPNSKISAAIAAVLGTATFAGSAFANDVPPTLAEASGSTAVQLYVAGSSAAKNAILGALEVNLCGGIANATVVSSVSNKNFGAVSCTPANGTAGADGNTYYTVYYRFEGGSVVGALPLVNNDIVQTLDLTKNSFIACSAGTGSTGSGTCSATVTGSSSANGTTDTFTGPVTQQAVHLGVLDVEPAALATANNYPTAYSTSAWGPQNPSGLTTLAKAGLFDEVYGFYVNGLPANLSLSTETLTAILTKKITNWSKVTDTAGAQVSSTSLPIVVVNREQGSGSRAAADLLIVGDTCQTLQSTGIKEPPTTVDYFSTGDVLNAASSTNGSITYATIDNAPVSSTQQLININGVQPNTLNAATGAYPFWTEATVAVNPNSALSTQQTALLSFITTTLQAIATAPHLKDINAIPGIAGNTGHVNVAGNGDTALNTNLGTATIYVNPFTRNQISCSVPSNSASVQ
jgi:PBP superfamily domain